MSVKMVLIDDLDDKTEGAQRVTFYWHGWWEIDVSAKHLADMERAFGPYVNSAHKTAGPPGTAAGKPGRLRRR